MATSLLLNNDARPASVESRKKLAKGQTVFAGKTRPQNFLTAPIGKSTALRIARGGVRRRQTWRTATAAAGGGSASF
jgi:hypothetical protein